MKIAVVGSRSFKSLDEVKDFVNNEFKPEDILISGAAKGVDFMAEVTADQRGIKKEIHIPEWSKYGRRAGFLRNQKIIAMADRVVAFWDGVSKGTLHSINLAKAANKPVTVYRPGEYRREAAKIS